MRWNNLDDQYLIENYSETDKNDLLTRLPYRTWDAIKLRANKLKVYRSSKFFRKSSTEILLDNSLISYYWLGFILADGHISDNKRLVITLSIKDKEHLEKLQKYINSSLIREGTTIANNIEYARVTLAVQDIDVIPKLSKIYSIKSNKTINPPNIKEYTSDEEQLLSLIVGFIDGDGSITKLQNRQDVSLRIKCHGTWLANLCYMEDILYAKFKYPKKIDRLTKINTAGYANLTISNNKLIKDLKTFAQNNKLPVLERKWNKII